MSSADHDLTSPFSPFNTVVHNAIDRLMDLMKSFSFIFVMNGEVLEATMQESLQSDPLLSVFEFPHN
jgi:hypothetical protein